jgi:hypothetical protein
MPPTKIRAFIQDLANCLKNELQNHLLTMFTEFFKDKTIIKKYKSNGLVIKNDLTFDELLFAFDKVINKLQSISY